jgi:V/A-type H+-transporting ATPase subunit B
MRIEYLGLSEIRGPLIVLDSITGIGNEEICTLTLSNGETRFGRVIMLEGTRAVIQVFQGTRGISLENTRTHFQGHTMQIPLLVVESIQWLLVFQTHPKCYE